MVVGVWFLAVFCAVGFAFGCTEFLMARLDARRRVMLGTAGFPLILLVNLISLALLWLIATVLVAASGRNFYLPVLLIAVGAQAIWLAQHVWFYYRDRLRVRYE